MASTYELIVKAVDKTSGPMSKINKSVGRLDKQAKKTNGSLKLVGTALASIDKKVLLIYIELILFSF